MKLLFLFVFVFTSSHSFAQNEDWLREPSQAPNEPPYISEEEWEEKAPDSQPVKKNHSQTKKIPYDIIEETEDYYKVRHPLQRKGLYKITADGTYLYKRDRSKIEQFTGFRFGSQKFDQLINTQTNKTFDEVYSPAASLFLDFERPLFSWSQNFKQNYGLNFIYATGTGFLASSGAESQEGYKLIMLPIHYGFTYHFQYLGETQWIVPYAGVGADLFLIYELRDDGKAIRTYTYGGHANAGLRFLIDRWMSDLDDLDEDYGINHVWLSLDYKKIIGAEKDSIDISSDAITLGFGLDI